MCEEGNKLGRVGCKEALTMLIGCVITLSMVGCGIVKGSSSYLLNRAIKHVESEYVEDNEEEWLEDKIEDITGFEIDLSPSSEEEKEKLEINLLEF